MAKVTVYYRDFCGYCARAIALLERKGVEFEKINAGMDAEKKREMIQRSNGGATFPQIFINGEHIGGSDDMMALERAGKLDELLAA